MNHLAREKNVPWHLRVHTPDKPYPPSPVQVVLWLWSYLYLYFYHGVAWRPVSPKTWLPSQQRDLLCYHMAHIESWASVCPKVEVMCIPVAEGSPALLVHVSPSNFLCSAGPAVLLLVRWASVTRTPSFIPITHTMSWIIVIWDWDMGLAV